jgi:hypothetical protein
VLSPTLHLILVPKQSDTQFNRIPAISMNRFNMKQPLYLFRLVGVIFGITLCFASHTFAQTLIIGTLPGESNTITSYPTPYGGSHESMRAQYLYLASDLQLAGAEAGFITMVGFNVSDPNGIGALQHLKIGLSNTATGSLDSIAWEPIDSIVYDTAGYLPMGGGDLHFLQHPFYWDGASNLLVSICHEPDDAAGGIFETENASVDWTTDLPYNASRTFVANDAPPGICGVTDTAEAGNRANRPVLLLRFSCVQPDTIYLNSVTSVSVEFSWNDVASPNGYIWEIGYPNFTPGTGTALYSDTTLLTTASVHGLISDKPYKIYVRARCGSGTSWTGPLNFSSAPGCDDTFFDSGKSFADYKNNEQIQTVLCPNDSTDVLELGFATFDIAAGDTLRIYNGNDTSFPLYGAFSGNIIPPVFTSTTPSGCLTVVFTSDSSVTAPGWAAKLSCGIPDSCFTPTSLYISELKPKSARFDWVATFGAAGYKWKLTTPAGLIISADSTTTDEVFLDNLTEATFYDFYIKTICASGDSTAWVKISFHTPLDCIGSPNLSCSGITTAIMTGTGIFDPFKACNSDATPGRERVFQFIAPNTKSYTLDITSATGGNNYVHYGFKDATEGCDAGGWDCIIKTSLPDTAVFGPLTAGHKYYIVLDPETTASLTHVFKIKDCKPENDEAWTAAHIDFGTDCSANTYGTKFSTFNSAAGEPNPDSVAADGYVGRWLTPADGTVWFNFVAPTSGSVTIYTESVPNSANFDTQVALYAATDSSNYSTFTLLASDDDNGNTGLGYNSGISYSGLNPGEVYYIQADGFSTQEGVFCIRLTEELDRIDVADCSTPYTITGVDGTVPGGEHWYDIYTSPNALDLGELVAAIKPNGQKLDSVLCRVSISDTIPVNYNGFHFMPTYYYFSWSNMAATGPVEVRLFYANAEFDSLKLKSNAPVASAIGDLHASYYTGLNENCSYFDNDFTNTVSTGSLLSISAAKQVSSTGLFYLDTQIPSHGEVAAHLPAIVLPLELISFSGKMLEKTNVLEWVTQSEKNVLQHLLERSPDGVHWTELGRKTGQTVSASQIYYQLEDNQPFNESYYRLRSIDLDGQEAVSKTILLRREPGFGIDRVFPVPTSGILTVQFGTDQETNVSMRLYNLAGALMLEQSSEAVRGNNQTRLSLEALPAGLYFLQMNDGVRLSDPVKIFKN